MTGAKSTKMTRAEPESMLRIRGTRWFAPSVLEGVECDHVIGDWAGPSHRSVI
jgi:hypothetical protein